jgi:glycosyltransferase involved in cell wall biosynthesis
MRIAVFHDLPAGGAKRALHGLCRGLAGHGHHLDLFVPDTADETFLPLAPFVGAKSVVPVPGARRTAAGGPAAWTPLAWLFAPRCQRAIASAINRGGYDLAFVDLSRYPQVPFVLRHLNVPSVLYCHEPNRVLYDAAVADAEARGLRERLRAHAGVRAVILPILHRRRAERRNIACATTVLANSYFSRAAILRTFGVEATVSYLGVDVQMFHPRGLPREPLLLSVGVVHPAKGYGFLIDSLARVPAAFRPPLLIVGARAKAGHAARLRRRAEQAGIALAIREGVSDEELVGCYNRATAVAYVPYLEPFGFVPLEAMACGTPVVAVREGGVRECVRDGVTGLLVDRDPEACAAAIMRLMDDPGLRAHLGREARREVEARWTWERSVTELVPMLERTANGTGGRLAAKQA